MTNSDEIECLAGRIWLAHLNGAHSDPASLVPLRTERELSAEFGVTRHAARNAIKLLEDGGKVRRVGGRAVILLNAKSGGDNETVSKSIQCINIFEPPYGSAPDLQWLRQDYQTGHCLALDDLDIKTRLIVCPDDIGDPASLLWHLAPFRAQACLLVNRWMPRLLTWLHENGVHFVVQGRRLYESTDLPPHHKVYINRVGAGFDATQHLLGLGHRRIGYIGPLKVDGGQSHTFQGYDAAVRCAGLAPHSSDWLELQGEVSEQMIDPIKAFLMQPERPTAILTANDAMAVAALRAARALGVLVPRDLSVVGINDQPMAVTSEPPLTTMSVPRVELGRRTMRMLLDAWDKPEAEWRTEVLNCALVVRESSAPPPPDNRPTH